MGHKDRGDLFSYCKCSLYDCRGSRIRRHMAQCTPSCIPRKGWFVALVFISIIVTMGLIFFDHTFARKLRSEHIEETVAVMRTRLKFIESQYQGRQQEVADEQARLANGCNPEVRAKSDGPNVTYPSELTALLKEISGSKASDGLLPSNRPESIKAPFSLRIMPHLLNNPDSLRPAYQLGSGKHFADYIIGVPHVKRDKETYLYDTIRSLLDEMDEVHKNYTMIVVMIGETNLTYVVETAHHIEMTFPEAVAAGLIEVLSPNENYYPDLDALPQTLGDSKKRVKWRTKQNLDAIYLMAFAHSRCLYYLMIEDDVLAAEDYMEQIREYTAETTVVNPGWFFIQYSTTGGIGKLFRSTDLIHFMTYVQLFYLNMPIDWLTESYLADRNCGINKGAVSRPIVTTTEDPVFSYMPKDSEYSEEDIVNVKTDDNDDDAAETYDFYDDSLHDITNFDNHTNTPPRIRSHSEKVQEKECADAKTKIRPTYKNNLFKHIGLYSSLKGKIQKVKDLKAQKKPEFFPHDNPPVTKIECTLIQHQNYSIFNAYKGLTYFWGHSPRKGDTIEFWFETPGIFDRYFVRSGNSQHVNDRIYKAVFEVLPVSDGKNGTFEIIDNFDEFGMVEGQVDTIYTDILAMRIRFTESSKYWVTISEIEFNIVKEPVAQYRRQNHNGGLVY